jgi:hypothetical protein
MFGSLIRLVPDDEIDAAIERILTHKRIEQLARRIAEMLLEKQSQEQDREG